MSDKKSLYQELYGDKEVYAESVKQVRLNEACHKAVYHLEVYHGYGRSDASHVIEELSSEWDRDEVEAIIKNGIIKKVFKEAEDALIAMGAVKKIVS